MKNTAIEELISNHKKRLDETKQLNSSFWYLQQLENDATELIEKEKELQAKHDEEKKQAVVDAYVDGCDLGTYEQNTKEAIQYYEANFNTKETITLCCCTHQQACEVCGNEKGLDSDFWNSIR
jgi:hypothetical protein